MPVRKARRDHGTESRIQGLCGGPWGKHASGPTLTDAPDCRAHGQ